ncbi:MULTISPECIES: hypothetical protein [Pirellulaceae]|nr:MULTISPECIES: hypothetical protein [Pirellulaceae]
MLLGIGISLAVFVVFAGVVVGFEGFQSSRQHHLQGINQEHAKQLFRLRREWLETEFMKAAASSGKPRGLRWVDCEFDDDVHFAFDEEIGLLRAFISITVQFEAIQGGDMEDVEAVGVLRAATGFFEYNGVRWIACPRVIFNLSPNQAIQHFHHRSLSID